MAEYRKRVWVRNTTAIYRMHVENEISFLVVHNKIAKNTFPTLETAKVHAQSLWSGIPPKNLNFEFYKKAAANFNEFEAHTGELSIHLLTNLMILKKPTSERTIERLNQLALIPSSHVIPSNEKEFYSWTQTTVDELSNFTKKRTLRSKRSVIARLQEFNHIIKTIKLFPIAFKRWINLVAVFDAKVQSSKPMKINSKTDIKSFECLTLKEIDDLLGRCESFSESSCVIAALTSGLRSGEFEKVRANHIGRHNTLNMLEIVTKTKVRKNPQASLALILCASYSNGVIPSGVNKKRFRPTCAVNLMQCGYPMLNISERLGHTTTLMIQNHYAKILPSDWTTENSASQYLGIGELKVGDWVCNENDWDKWCLRLLLRQASRWGVLGEVKEKLLGLVEMKPETTLKFVDSF